MRKILAFTSIRSDYDLMSPLYRLLHDDKEIDFRLLVSGAHLSHAFGHTVDEIRKDGFKLLLEIETLLSSDTELSRVKSASLLLQNSLETIASFSPDLMVYAGDREDVLIYSMIGGYLSIPTLHFFAGDHVRDGYIDNPIRHATSKLSTAHFVSLLEHKERLLCMGEEPERVHVVGNISLDKFKNFKPLSKAEIMKFFKLKSLYERFALVIFHPISEERPKAGEYFENILTTLEEKEIGAFVGFPNVDPGNHSLLKVIEKYKNNPNFTFYKSLNREVFMSLYKNAELIIGNSSSGICEAASFRIPAVNVGLRQTGRFADRNVIFCEADLASVKRAVNKAISTDFKLNLDGLKNSYGDGESAAKAYNIIKTVDFEAMVAKKEDPLK